MKALWELALRSWQSPLHPCPPPNRHPAIWTCVITEGQRRTPSHPHLLQGRAGGPGAWGWGRGRHRKSRRQGSKETVTDPE